MRYINRLFTYLLTLVLIPHVKVSTLAFVLKMCESWLRSSDKGLCLDYNIDKRV